MYPYFLPFYWQIIFHCMNIHRYLFISWIWVVSIFFFTIMHNAAMNIHIFFIYFLLGVSLFTLLIFSSMFLQIWYTTISDRSRPRRPTNVQIYQVKVFPFVFWKPFPWAFSFALIWMTTLKSTAYIAFLQNRPSVHLCVRAPITWIPCHPLSQLIPLFGGSWVGPERAAGVQLLCIYAGFQMMFPITPPISEFPQIPMWIGSLPIGISPLSAFSSPKYALKALMCWRFFFSSLFLQNLYRPCPFTIIGKGSLEREEVNKWNECLSWGVRSWFLSMI